IAGSAQEDTTPKTRINYRICRIAHCPPHKELGNRSVSVKCPKYLWIGGKALHVKHMLRPGGSLYVRFGPIRLFHYFRLMGQNRYFPQWVFNCRHGLMEL